MLNTSLNYTILWKRLYLSILLALSACTSKSDVEKSLANLLHPQATIMTTFGFDETDDPDSYIGYPEDLAILNDAFIYIADRSSMSVKKFTLEGKYVTSLGTKGEAPGEFMSISNLHIDTKSRLLVFDARQRRILIFQDDKFITMKTISDEILGIIGKDTFELDEFLYLGANKLNLYSDIDESATLLHEVDISTDSSFLKHSFLDVLSLDYSDQEYVPFSYGFDPGKIFYGNNKLFYSPFIYSNKLLVFKREKENWKPLDSWIGHTFWEGDVWKRVDTKDEDATFTMHGEVSYGAIIGSQSEGVFQLSSGNIIQFVSVALSHTHKRKLAMNIFSPDGKLLGYGEFDKIKLEDGSSAYLYFKPLAIDENYFLYGIDYTTNSTWIRKLKISF